MTRRAWLGSSVVHALVIAALAWCVERRPPVRRMEPPVEIEVVAGAPPTVPVPAPPAAPQQREPRASAPRKAAPRGSAPRKAAPRASKAAPATRPALAIEAEDRSGRGAGSGQGLDNGQGNGSGNGGGNGNGNGDGNGNGNGNRLGDRNSLDLGPHLVAPPPPPRLSKARPPILLYPARDRPERSGAVFVADLTIDSDGYVTAVALKPGGGARRDRDQAADAVWRFRYSPALDDDGQPVTARIEQRFMVE